MKHRIRRRKAAKAARRGVIPPTFPTKYRSAGHAARASSASQAIAREIAARAKLSR